MPVVTNAKCLNAQAASSSMTVSYNSALEDLGVTFTPGDVTVSAVRATYWIITEPCPTSARSGLRISRTWNRESLGAVIARMPQMHSSLQRDLLSRLVQVW